MKVKLNVQFAKKINLFGPYNKVPFSHLNSH